MKNKAVYITIGGLIIFVAGYILWLMRAVKKRIAIDLTAFKLDITLSLVQNFTLTAAINNGMENKFSVSRLYVDIYANSIKVSTLEKKSFTIEKNSITEVALSGTVDLAKLGISAITDIGNFTVPKFKAKGAVTITKFFIPFTVTIEKDLN